MRWIAAYRHFRQRVPLTKRTYQARARMGSHPAIDGRSHLKLDGKRFKFPVYPYPINMDQIRGENQNLCYDHLIVCHTYEEIATFTHNHLIN